MKRQAHLIGSVALRDAETVFTTVSEILGSSCSRIPDGETGDRTNWNRWQRGTFASHPYFEHGFTTETLPGFTDRIERTFFKLKDRIDRTTLEFGGMGYACEAIESYRTFDRLAADGKIARGTRFQVALPTPVALLCGFVVPGHHLRIEPALEAAVIAELRRIQHSIPGNRLSIQWDVCFEVVGAAGGFPLPYRDAIGGSVERIGRLCSEVNDAVELGVHLCYGDPGHKHIIEPTDLNICVAMANGINRGSRRQLNFVHMPVPRNRADEAYFAPLEKLELPASTRLILGLVHYTDGVEGSRRRAAVAARYARHFDVATECGFGRRDPATVPDLLRMHKELCM